MMPETAMNAISQSMKRKRLLKLAEDRYEAVNLSVAVVTTPPLLKKWHEISLPEVPTPDVARTTGLLPDVPNHMGVMGVVVMNMITILTMTVLEGGTESVCPFTVLSRAIY